jgi:hypothetical protein
MYVYGMIHAAALRYVYVRQTGAAFVKTTKRASFNVRVRRVCKSLRAKMNE